MATPKIKSSCVKNVVNISTKPTPSSLPSLPPQNDPNSGALALLLTHFAYLDMLFILQLDCTAGRLGYKQKEITHFPFPVIIVQREKFCVIFACLGTAVIQNVEMSSKIPASVALIYDHVFHAIRISS